MSQSLFPSFVIHFVQSVIIYSSKYHYRIRVIQITYFNFKTFGNAIEMRCIIISSACIKSILDQIIFKSILYIHCLFHPKSVNRAQLLILPTLKAFRLPLHRSRWGRRQQKKPAPQSYLEVKALALPETKIRKAVRALWARSVSVLPCFVQICEILTFRQVVSLPIFSVCKYTHYFIPQ